MRAPRQGAGSARLTLQEAVQTATTRRPCPTHRRLSPARVGFPCGRAPGRALCPRGARALPEEPGNLDPGLDREQKGTWVQETTPPTPATGWGASASPMLSSG